MHTFFPYVIIAGCRVSYWKVIGSMEMCFLNLLVETCLCLLRCDSTKEKWNRS